MSTPPRTKRKASSQLQKDSEPDGGVTTLAPTSQVFFPPRSGRGDVGNRSSETTKQFNPVGICPGHNEGRSNADEINRPVADSIQPAIATAPPQYLLPRVGAPVPPQLQKFLSARSLWGADSPVPREPPYFDRYYRNYWSQTPSEVYSMPGFNRPQSMRLEDLINSLDSARTLPAAHTPPQIGAGRNLTSEEANIFLSANFRHGSQQHAELGPSGFHSPTLQPSGYQSFTYPAFPRIRPPSPQFLVNDIGSPHTPQNLNCQYAGDFIEPQAGQSSSGDYSQYPRPPTQLLGNPFAYEGRLPQPFPAMTEAGDFINPPPRSNLSEPPPPEPRVLIPSHRIPRHRAVNEGRHIRKIQRGGKTRFLCTICDRDYASENGCMRHQLEHFNEGVVCPFCKNPTVWKRADHLQVHAQRVHPKIERSVWLPLMQQLTRNVDWDLYWVRGGRTKKSYPERTAEGGDEVDEGGETSDAGSDGRHEQALAEIGPENENASHQGTGEGRTVEGTSVVIEGTSEAVGDCADEVE